ncbi:major facilitator superfamily domain-containing protein [Paraphoma chrysanthemicola]|uniref:Major facilitator superfamily domain-containing protein n=1 Tax=Paraphoma chrysanthemicola TaxID=798071 RepID=A0A8K0R261_9PLEO|nr:major facilitator superfamily domain-containing protein [Paraphoma chrysanthemicola]
MRNMLCTTLDRSWTHDEHQTDNLFKLIGSLYLGTFLVALDTTILGTVIPSISSVFHALDDIAWYGSAYLLTLTALQPTFGKLYKIFDTKTLYLASIVVFEVGSTLCASAPSSVVFIIGRAVAVCGAAGLMRSFAIVTKTVPLARRQFYFGLFVSAFGVSIGVGPVLGGLLADRGIWRWCFWINLPLGAIVFTLVAILLKLKDDKVAKQHRGNSLSQRSFQLDIAGSILLIASMTSLFLAMQWGGLRLPWTSPTVAGLLTLSGVLLALFILWEWRMGDEASIPFRILRQRSTAFGVVYIFMFSFPNFAYGVYLPMFFQAVKDFSAQRSGAETLFLALTQILAVVVVGALDSKFGYYTPFIIGGTAFNMVGSGLITLLDFETSHAARAAYFVLCGIGTGCTINLPYTAISTSLDENDMVTGNALFQFAFQLGGAISLCISQTLFIDRLAGNVNSELHGVAIEAIVDAGAFNLQSLVSSQAQLRALRLSYRDAIRDVFVLLLVASGLALIAALGFEHKNVRKVERERKVDGEQKGSHGGEDC